MALLLASSRQGPAEGVELGKHVEWSPTKGQVRPVRIGFGPSRAVRGLAEIAFHSHLQLLPLQCLSCCPLVIGVLPAVGCLQRLRVCLLRG